MLASLLGMPLYCRLCQPGPSVLPSAGAVFVDAVYVTGNLLLSKGYILLSVTASVLYGRAIGSDWHGPPALDHLAAHLFPRNATEGVALALAERLWVPTHLPLRPRGPNAPRVGPRCLLAPSRAANLQHARNGPVTKHEYGAPPARSPPGCQPWYA